MAAACAPMPPLTGSWSLTLHADDSLPALAPDVTGALRLIEDSVGSHTYHGDFALDVPRLFGADTPDSSVVGSTGRDFGLFLRLGGGFDRGEIELHADRPDSTTIAGHWLQVFGENTPFRGGSFVLRRTQ